MKRPRQQKLQQLYKPGNPSCIQQAELLLRTEGLSDQDVIDFLLGGRIKQPANDNNNVNITNDMSHHFHQRRIEIRKLKEDLTRDRARIDEDGRLVPVEAEDQQQQQQGQQEEPQPAAQILQQLDINMEQQEEQLIEQEQREAAEAIARAVARYREQNVAEDDLELVVIPPRERRGVNPAWRRLWFAVSICLSAFAVFVPHRIPFLNTLEKVDPRFDKLVHELVNVREFQTHIQHCPSLHRDGESDLKDPFFWMFHHVPETSCDDGVLHIPAKHVIFDKFLNARNEESAVQSRPLKDGISVSWDIPCHSQESNPSYPATECNQKRCFRGVHDNFISEKEIAGILQMGRDLIQGGNQHNEVYVASSLEKRLPKVLKKVRRLLRDEYQVKEPLPIAFRITNSWPIDGFGVDWAPTLNHSVYLARIEKNRAHNEMVSYSPWPFKGEPARDRCHLIADQEVNPKFAVHTSIFLVSGAGGHYRGGCTLFMDDHYSNFNEKERLRRGLLVDGSEGRIIVSTGGLENRRCRLPVRAGLRVELQIWWNY